MTGWLHAALGRRVPPPQAVPPGAEACWCCGRPGTGYRPGFLACRAHPEGLVTWYAGAVPPPLPGVIREMS